MNNYTQGKWYFVRPDGDLVLCENRNEAELLVEAANKEWPHNGPRKAMQLVDAAEVEELKARVAELESQLESVGAGWALVPQEGELTNSQIAHTAGRLGGFLESAPLGKQWGLVYELVRKVIRERCTPPAQTPPPLLTDEQRGALMRAYTCANSKAITANVPECASFADIAQDLDWLCGQFGMKSQEGGAV